MITNAREIIEASDIVNVIGLDIKLSKKGIHHIGLCPLHGEKSPSFKVNPAKQMWKCFGCHKGGDVVSFVREMHKDNFVQAIERIAKTVNIAPIYNTKAEEDPLFEAKKTMRIALSALQATFAVGENPQTLAYWLERGFTTETLNDFGVGYCDGTKPLMVDLSKTGLVNDAGNVTMYQRTTLPIHNRQGQIVTFAGRILPGKSQSSGAKWINGGANLIYNKSQTLFNLHRADKEIYAAGEVWLVEGYGDAMAMHQSGVPQVVAPCGTAFTIEQIDLLKRYARNARLRVVIAINNEIFGAQRKPSIWMVFDKLLHQLLAFAEVRVVVYPIGFNDMAELLKAGHDLRGLTTHDALVRWQEEQTMHPDYRTGSVHDKAQVHQRLTELIAQVPLLEARQLYTKDLLAPLTGADSDMTRVAEAASVPQDVDESELEAWVKALQWQFPTEQCAKDAFTFGFYQHKNMYWVLRKTKDALYYIEVSNFVLDAKYLIAGAQPKRIVDMINVFGKTVTIDFDIEDLISLDKFKGRVERHGNFLFSGTGTDLAKIKSKLFSRERYANEVSRLGQNKYGWAFANGIYANNQWLPTDESGMVKANDAWYYIPALANTKGADDEDLRNYRRFAHQPSAHKMASWSNQFIEVYKSNGMFGLAFYLSAVFSDIIFDVTKAAPMLFLYGQRGSGKGTMANSLLALFGTPQDPIMLGGASTVVGFMRKLAQFFNALTWLDEYKNDIGDKKIESLKNIWDRIGYERGVKDSSNRTQSSSVTSSAILSGQEIPNVEPALFSRTILCEFNNYTYTQADIDKFNRLREMEQDGLTSITLEVLNHRAAFKAAFTKEFKEIASVMRNGVEQKTIERLVVNYAILITTVKILGNYLPLPFTYTELIKQSEEFIKRQTGMMSEANEIKSFFNMVSYLLDAGEIHHGIDVQVTPTHLRMRLPKIIGKYRDHGKRQGLRVLDQGTLMNYLEACEAFNRKESEKSALRFSKLHNPMRCKVFNLAELSSEFDIDFKESQTPEELQMAV
jgi:DNA primase